MTRRAATGS
jgi:hypothetical protein